MESSREWERWDDPGVAEDIDRYWTEDPTGYESVYRAVLAELVKAYSVSPLDRVLEVGCGSGLIYQTLVPELFVNSNYVGVDTSSAMLRLARQRFPDGQFVRDDIYNLRFPTKSFDVVLCFEVLSHLPEIHQPLRELIRVAARALIFTVWVSPDATTHTRAEQFRDSKFLHREYAHAEITATIHQAASGAAHRIETRPLSDLTWAYIVHLDPSVQSTDAVIPFPGLTARMLRATVQARGRFKSDLAQTRDALAAREMELAQLGATLAARETDIAQLGATLTAHATELAQTRNMLAARASELAQMHNALAACETEITQRDAMLAARETELVKTRATLQTRDAEAMQLRAALQSHQTELSLSRAKGGAIVNELDAFRQRRLNRWLDRVTNRADAAPHLAPAFLQLKDDSYIFARDLTGFLLQPSDDLRRVEFVYYPLELDRANLRGILLAAIFDFPPTQGILGIESVSPANQIVAQVTRPASEINDAEPVRFDFAPLRDSNQGRFWLRVFVRDADAPIRIFEWRKYAWFGLGRLRTRAFCGFVFE
jgi:SAM-dependent methyltransferase